MPIYKYRCNKCKKEFEVIQFIKDKPLEECKFCTGIVERIIQPINVNTHFKGSYNLTKKTDML